MIQINLGKVILQQSSKTKMKKNILRVFLLSLLFPYFLSAQVFLKAPDTFYKGDVVSFSILAFGSDVKIPEITTIDGMSVENTGNSRQTTIVNGSTTYQLTKSYAFIANKDVKIPSFEIEIDNKIEKTDEHFIKMLAVEKTKSELYDLTINIDKSEVYTGEAVVFSLKFKYKKDLEIVSLDFKQPTFEDFWVKELKQPQKQNNVVNGYVEQEIKYLLFPQKQGKIELGAFKIGVTTLKNSGSRGFFLSAPTVTTPVYSNKLKLNVKALPQGVNLIGDFEISSTISKNSVNQGEAVSYKLNIKGRGNVDDLDEVVLEIPQTTIYGNPSEKKYNLQDNIYGGTYSKNYSIVGKDDFTIPSIQLRYFDKKTQTIKTIQTKSYDIKVLKSIQNTSNNEKKLSVADTKLEVANTQITSKNENIMQNNNSQKLVWFFLGFITALVFIFIYLKIKNQKENSSDDKPLIKLVKKSKTPQELFRVLVVYINIDEELDKIIYKLEKLTEEEYKKEQKNIIKALNEILKKDIKLDSHL